MRIAHDLKKNLDSAGPDIDFSGTWESGIGLYHVADFREKLDQIAEGLSANGNKFVTCFSLEKGCAQILELGSSVVITEVEVIGEAGTVDWMTVRLVFEQQRLQKLFEDLLPDRVLVKIVESF